jgi:serine O-acetyltransferase
MHEVLEENPMDRGLRALPEDLRRTYSLTSGPRIVRWVKCARAPGVQTVVVYRFGQWVMGLPLPLRILFEPFYFVLNGLIKILWGIELPRAALFGSGLYIGHFGGITVSSGTVAGRRCNLSQGVTIGVSGQGDRRGTPVIGDNVYIAPGARLFGRIRVGNNVKVGANAVVHADIPDNAVVVLDPGFRIVSYKGNQRATADSLAAPSDLTHG